MTAAATVSRFRGRYMIQKAGTKRQQHRDRAAAEAEATRLAMRNPGDVFLITQAIASVKAGDGA